MTRPETLTVLFLEYARTMREAQMFEAALQFIAAGELDLAHPDFRDDANTRTEWFFSRPISWLQRRLELPTELIQEIDELRKERNHLAHGFLVRMSFNEPDEVDATASATSDQFLDKLPAPARRDYELHLAAAWAEAESERLTTIEELRALRARFKSCNSRLNARWLAWLPHASSWEEVERFLGDAGAEKDQS
jgi:hypothetical protein